jgi:hypothetical protein
MCIVSITLPVQSQVNERSCVLLQLHYLYKAKTMSGNVYCYHYATCTKPGQWAVMRIVTITTGSVMETIHMTVHLPGFVQVV